MRAKKGEVVTHNGRKWMVEKVLIQGRPDHGQRAYLRACPMCGEQVLTRSTRTIGDDWE